MKIKSFLQNRMESTIGNEVIGDLGFEKEEVKIKKKNKIKDEEYFFEEEKPPLQKKEQEKISYAVLSKLRIRENIDISNLINDSDIEELEFTLTGPTGIDPDEVERFCDALQEDLKRYISIFYEREADIKKLVKENNSLESAFINLRQSHELSSYMNTNKKQEETYKEQILNLKLENKKLNAKISELEKKLQTHQQNLINQGTKPIEKGGISLPSIYEIKDEDKKEVEVDAFNKLLEDLNSN